MIEHEDQIYTFYAHLKKGTFKVKQGDHVMAGEVLAEIGCSGYCEADHLHVEAFYGVGNQRQSLPIKILDSSGSARMIYERDEEVWSLEKKTNRYQHSQGHR